MHAVSYSDPIDKTIRFLFIDTLNAMRDSHRAYFEGKFRSAGIIKPEEMMINVCFDQCEYTLFLVNGLIFLVAFSFTSISL